MQDFRYLANVSTLKLIPKNVLVAANALKSALMEYCNYPMARRKLQDLDGCMECGACVEQLGHTKQLEQLGIEVKYTGELLTQLLKGEKCLLTI